MKTEHEIQVSVKIFEPNRKRIQSSETAILKF
jgi:hypothetical protein